MNRTNSNSWLKHWDFILLDMLILEIAFMLTCSARLGWQNPFHDTLYTSTGIVVLLAGFCAAFFLNGYTGIMRRGRFQELIAAIKYICFVCACEGIFLFMSKNASLFPRGAFLGFVALSLVLTYTERLLWKKYLLTHHKVLYRKKGLLFLTTKALAEKTLQTALANTYNELAILGLILLDDDSCVGQEVEGIPVVCRAMDLPDYILNGWVDGIVVNADREELLPDELMEQLVEMGVTVYRRIADADSANNCQQVEKVAGYVVLSTSMHVVSAQQMMAKRALDICGGIVGMLLTAIFTVIFGPAIYLSSPGPIFFSQIRVGKNGRFFKMYKFRSMYMDAEQRKQDLMEKNQMDGLMFKLDADPRIIGSGPDGTKKGIGWFIRKTSIDEFPQFWNVLKGDMSLVGTRPPTLDEWEHYGYYHRGRMAVKPGLTGLWQVSGRSDITDFEEVVRLDKEYIRTWSFGLDIKLLMKTVGVVLTGRGSK